MAVMGVTIGCAQPYAIYMSSLLCRFAGYYVLRQVYETKACDLVSAHEDSHAGDSGMWLTAHNSHPSHKHTYLAQPIEFYGLAILLHSEVEPEWPSWGYH